MRIHSNATTTPATRRLIQEASGSIAEISRRFHVSWQTVKRWRGRDEVEDRSSRPKRIKSAFDEATQAVLVEQRKLDMSLDEVFEANMDQMPKLSRSSLWRLFRRHGLGRLKKVRDKAHSKFKPYPPGYVHIDSFYTPRFGSTRYYGFVAIDRASRRTCVAVYDSRSQKSGADFLRKCIEGFEFNIRRVLTDNGTEFTNKTYNRNGKAKVVHAFDKVCKEHQIEHRLTKPRTPKTNGMAERQVAIVKNATVRARTYISPEAMEQDIAAWNDKNNARRQRRISYKSPLQVCQEWYDLNAELFKREPMPKTA
jgi:transposase InsO family protein